MQKSENFHFKRQYLKRYFDRLTKHITESELEKLEKNIQKFAAKVITGRNAQALNDSLYSVYQEFYLKGGKQ